MRLWWLRSVDSGYTSAFRRVTADGSSYGSYAYFSFGFAPGFKVA